MPTSSSPQTMLTDKPTAGAALLSSTYFGPIQWYQKVASHNPVWVDHSEPFRKQSYHNRCIIMTANGPQALIVPVTQHPTPNTQHPTPTASDGSPVGTHPSPPLLSDHGKWRHEHWNALQTAYGDSPFFLYYADDIRPFFEEERWTSLYDFNLSITRTLCELLDIDSPEPLPTEAAPYPQNREGAPSGDNVGAQPCSAPFLLEGLREASDFRRIIHPKHPLPDPDFIPRPYYQVYRQRHGFHPNLSVLDLLFNMGPEATLYLRQPAPPSNLSGSVLCP